MSTTTTTTDLAAAAAAATPPPALTQSPYPAQTREASATIAGQPTCVNYVGFADRILITVTQLGRGPAQWFHVSLDNVSSTPAQPIYSSTALEDEDENDLEQSMLPVSHLTPTTLLGGGGTEREAQGQLYAVQIASAIRMRDADEARTVVIALGLQGSGRDELDRDSFFGILGLVGQVI
ncbi:hypothetical protein DFH27DRAFT_546443 [Peziza echinospora]|nr:hypothetical protein DFH27DRAFT_546443 [Peziza echinospora]